MYVQYKLIKHSTESEYFISECLKSDPEINKIFSVFTFL